MPERWLPVPGYEGLYEVSDLGRVSSIRRSGTPGGLRKAWLRGDYLQVNLGNKAMRVHRLVCLAFYGPCPPGQEVRHLDGNKVNNALVNLAYGTRSENNTDTVRHGGNRWANVTHCPNGHPYDEANTYLLRGKRYCRECRHARQRRAAVA